MSLQEYLAAEGIVEPGVQALETLKAHVTDLRWSEVGACTIALLEKRDSTGRMLLDALAGHALRIREAGPGAAAFTVLLGAALGADVWSEALASVLQAARLMIEDAREATSALEPVVALAMRLHGKGD